VPFWFSYLALLHVGWSRIGVAQVERECADVTNEGARSPVTGVCAQTQTALQEGVAPCAKKLTVVGSQPSLRATKKSPIVNHTA
jgi:hypothetical protein